MSGTSFSGTLATTRPAKDRRFMHFSPETRARFFGAVPAARPRLSQVVFPLELRASAKYISHLGDICGTLCSPVLLLHCELSAYDLDRRAIGTACDPLRCPFAAREVAGVLRPSIAIDEHFVRLSDHNP